MAVAGIPIAKTDKLVELLPKMANRHGLIAGATGTGKTVTLQTMAEGFSKIGVPVFMADVKGDLSGMAKPGGNNPKVAERLLQLKLTDHKYEACPVVFWDVFGIKGHPVRTTISEMGPVLLSRMLNLNETQEGVLTLSFKVADDNGLLLLDYKDLRAMLEFVGKNAKDLTTEYGNISAASVGAIQRGLLTLEQQGGEKFFGEPALDISDLIQTGANGRGVVNILAADKLMNSPKVYATFLLWLLSELFEHLPEVGDMEKPKLVFFFDEAHLLFNDAPDVLLEKIEQVVRLIRSKGVGVYFITQSPSDIPNTVLAQLGNRVQHALRAFTPADQKAVSAAAKTFRPNPKLGSVEEIITQLGVGEALVSFLEETGTPGMVQRAMVMPPGTRVGALNDDERKQVVSGSVLQGHYENLVDRESAYEILKGRVPGETETDTRSADERKTDFRSKNEEKIRAEQEKAAAKAAKEAERARKGSIMGKITDSITRNVTNTIGRTISRGVFGTILGGLFGKKR